MSIVLVKAHRRGKSAVKSYLRAKNSAGKVFTQIWQPGISKRRVDSLKRRFTFLNNTKFDNYMAAATKFKPGTSKSLFSNTRLSRRMKGTR